MPSKKVRARARRRADLRLVDAARMPEATRVYVDVGALSPQLADFAVQTTHGELQRAIESFRRDAGDVAPVRDSIAAALCRYDRAQLVEWAESPAPPDEWSAWCADVVLAVALKHVHDGQPVRMVRPGARADVAEPG